MKTFRILKAIYLYVRDLTTEESRMKFHLAVQYILKGKGDYDLDDKAILVKSRYELSKRNGYNAKSEQRHGAAIKNSGSRYEELKNLDLPSLVIHGTDDPLIEFRHAQKYAPMIPGVTTLFIEGMGHDLPRKLTPKILGAIKTLLDKKIIN